MAHAPTPTRTDSSRRSLSTAAATSLYVGALLGPSLLLLPGLAAEIAGPASIVAWIALIGASAAIATIFTALGRRRPSSQGVAGYVREAFGSRAGRITRAWFIAGVVIGAPVVCLIGGEYAATLLGLGPRGALVAAAGILTVVLATSGRRSGSTATQQVLVAGLLVIVLLAVVTNVPRFDGANFTPFAPSGWPAIGRAATVVMLSFVGWEAVAPLIPRLADPARQVSRVTATAYVITAVVLLSTTVTTIGALGVDAATRVPFADLLAQSLGNGGRTLAALAAVALTLAATNAYLSGAVAMLESDASADARQPRRPATARRIVVTRTLGAALLVFGLQALGWASLDLVVALPTALFIGVYIATMFGAARLLAGSLRRLAIGVGFILTAVLAFAGVGALALPIIAATAGRRLTPTTPDQAADIPSRPVPMMSVTMHI